MIDTPTALDLARRLAGDPRCGFRVGMGIVGVERPGRSDRHRGLVTRIGGPGEWVTHGIGLAEPTDMTGRILVEGSLSGWMHPDDWTIDLDSWATVGCLLGMLAEAGDFVSLARNPAPTWWASGRATLPGSERGDTPGEAVARALLAAWGPA